MCRLNRIEFSEAGIGQTWLLSPRDNQYRLQCAMRTCVFVTGNPNKVIEVNAILGSSIPVRPLALDIPEIQGTLEEIATDKCRRATQIVRHLCESICSGSHLLKQDRR